MSVNNRNCPSIVANVRCPRPTDLVRRPRVCAVCAGVCRQRLVCYTQRKLLIYNEITQMCAVCAVCVGKTLLYIYLFFILFFSWLFNLNNKIATHTAHMSVYAACSPILPAHIAAHIAAHTPFAAHIVANHSRLIQFTVYPSSKNSSLFKLAGR